MTGAILAFPRRVAVSRIGVILTSEWSPIDTSTSHHPSLLESAQAVRQLGMASVREEDVLMAKDPAIEDSDQWPEFSLSRITVLSQDLGRPVSLLEAHEDCPVKVLGKLEPVGEEQLHLGSRVRV